jgi:hypothetical protein
MLVLNHQNVDEKTKTVALQKNATLQTNVVFAIYNAYARATATKGMQVEILLETGTHYIMPLEVSEYRNALKNELWVDTINPEFDLVIRPLTCLDVFEINMSYKSAACLDLRNPNATTFREVWLYNKAGSNFYVQVPSSLRWEGIIFDALDSIIHTAYINSFYYANYCYWRSD